MRHCRACDTDKPLSAFYAVHGVVRSRKCADCTKRLAREKAAATRATRQPAPVVFDEHPKHNPYRLLTCKTCNEEFKAAEGFWLKPNGAVKSNNCKACHRAYMREHWDQKNLPKPENNRFHEIMEYINERT